VSKHRNSGWPGEKQRHSMAARGIPTVLRDFSIKQITSKQESVLQLEVAKRIKKMMPDWRIFQTQFGILIKHNKTFHLIDVERTTGPTKRRGSQAPHRKGVVVEMMYNYNLKTYASDVLKTTIREAKDAESLINKIMNKITKKFVPLMKENKSHWYAERIYYDSDYKKIEVIK